MENALINIAKSELKALRTLAAADRLDPRSFDQLTTNLRCRLEDLEVFLDIRSMDPGQGDEPDFAVTREGILYMDEARPKTRDQVRATLVCLTGGRR